MSERCITKKVRYADVPDAMRALEEARRTWRVPPQRWYRCPHCGGYHLSLQAREGGQYTDAARAEAQRLKAAHRRRLNPFGELDA